MRRPYTLTAAAKINLHLKIIGDQLSETIPPTPTGYHELVMVLQSLDLADQVTVASNDTKTIQVDCSHPEVPQGDCNIAHRAAQLMQRSFPKAWDRHGGVTITIQKTIPVGAGLAGGSADAAAVLVGIDLLWDLGLTQPELQELGAKLGSDVPFCLMGGTALATGRGEKLSPLPDVDNLTVILAKFRSLSVSTAWAYQTYRQQFQTSYITDPTALTAHWQDIEAGSLVNAVSQGDWITLGQCLHNDLEQVVLPHYPVVAQLRNICCQQPGVLGTLMSGSGPTVFALLERADQAEVVQAGIRNAIATSADGDLQTMAADLELWITQTSTAGIAIAQQRHNLS